MLKFLDNGLKFIMIFSWLSRSEKNSGGNFSNISEMDIYFLSFLQMLGTFYPKKSSYHKNKNNISKIRAFSRKKVFLGILTKHNFLGKKTVGKNFVENLRDEINKFSLP